MRPCDKFQPTDYEETNVYDFQAWLIVNANGQYWFLTCLIKCITLWCSMLEGAWVPEWLHYGLLTVEYTRIKKGRVASTVEREGKGSLSVVQLFTTPWTVACQAPPSTGFSRQGYWSGLPFTSPGDLPDPEIEPRSPALQADALLPDPPGKLPL